jgi:hypothetical protein
MGNTQTGLNALFHFKSSPFEQLKEVCIAMIVEQNIAGPSSRARAGVMHSMIA